MTKHSVSPGGASSRAATASAARPENCRPISTGGRPGSGVPASTWSRPSTWRSLSNSVSAPVARLTAPRTTRRAPELTRSKSTAAAISARNSAMETAGSPAPGGAGGGAAPAPPGGAQRGAGTWRPRPARQPAQLVPEPAQPGGALVRRVAGDDRGVDGADRGAGDPVRMHAAFFERGAGARLIGAERRPSRQDQRAALEPGQVLVGSCPRHDPLPPPPPRPAGLQRARIGATVKQQVLAGDEPGLRAAQKGAGGAELLGRAEAAGRVLLLPLPPHLLERAAGALGHRRHVGAQAVGVERPRQQIVDRDVVAHGL